LKVFLGNAPWNKKGYYGVRAGSRWPHFEEEHLEYVPFPFFLAYATAVLEEDGFEVLLVDAVPEKLCEDDFIKRIEDFGPDLVVLEVSTISIETDLALVEKLRDKFGSSARIALCGLHEFMYYPEFLDEHDYVDFVLVGEYEYTLRELARALDAGKKEFSGIKGLIWRDSGGKAVSNPRREPIKNLEELPWPARHFLPMYDYHDEPGSIPRPSVQIWASRGCPFKCIFCAWPQIMYGENRWRPRSITDTVDEMEWLVAEWGFASVYFDDDTFNINRRRTIEFADEVRRRNIGVPWAIMARADLIDREVLTALARAGLVSLKYGVESASQELLNACGKKLRIERVKEAVRMTHEMGIKMHLTFMFGLPGETFETARDTIDLALELAPDSVQFTITTPFPGSRFYYQMEKEGKILTKDFSKYDGFRSAVIKTDNLTPSELEQIVCEANEIWNTFWWQRKFPDERSASQKVLDLVKHPARIPGAIERLIKPWTYQHRKRLERLGK